MTQPTALTRRVGVAALGLMMLAGAGCESRPSVSQTEEGRLVLGEAAAEQFVERGVLPAGRTLVLQGFTGSVMLEGTEAPEAALTFVKRARGKSDAAAQKALQGIEISEVGSALTFQYVVQVRQPAVSRVDVRGTVPRGTPIRLQLGSGAVALSGVEGPITIDSEGGDVRIAGANAAVDVAVRNGAIDVGMQGLPPAASVQLRTVNGDLTLTLPADVSAAVQAQTTTGAIRAEGLGFAGRKLDPRGAGARFTGRLADGKAAIELRTENGSITLREGRVLRLAPEAGPQAPDSVQTAPPDTSRARPVATAQARNRVRPRP